MLLLLRLLLPQVIEVDAAAGVLVLGGVDIVDGSPVLDVKPYVPFSDALPGATAPDWVAVSCRAACCDAWYLADLRMQLIV